MLIHGSRLGPSLDGSGASSGTRGPVVRFRSITPARPTSPTPQAKVLSKARSKDRRRRRELLFDVRSKRRAAPTSWGLLTRTARPSQLPPQPTPWPRGPLAHSPRRIPWPSPTGEGSGRSRARLEWFGLARGMVKLRCGCGCVSVPWRLPDDCAAQNYILKKLLEDINSPAEPSPLSSQAWPVPERARPREAHRLPVPPARCG